MTRADKIERLRLMEERERRDALWKPLPGPQRLALESEADILGYGGAAGGGKGQPVDAPILTPFGFRPMGSLRVGSLVCNPDGSVATVIGVYPLGQRQLYRFTFHDGTSCEVTDDHIWLAWQCRRSTKNKDSRRHGEESARLWTTRQIIAAMSRGVRLSMPLTEAVTFTDSARYERRPVDPYLLGVLLGDGSITAKCLRISCADPAIIERIEQRTGLKLLGPYSYEGRAPEYRLCEPNDARAHLSKWGLVGKGSADKFIPAAYLQGPVESRWELLRGLMDTDGWAEADGDAYYCTISPRLRDDVATLARSLGALVTIRAKDAKAQNGNGSRAYTLRLKLRVPSLAFALLRKRERCESKCPQSMGRRLVSIEPTRVAEAQCIKVSHPNSLYITDDFIVTHNTDLACGKALRRHKSIMILRRQATELTAVIERLTQLIGNRDGYNGQAKLWRLADRMIEFGSVPHPGDERKYQGRPHDLLVFDEAANFLEHQVRFLLGWLRTTDPAQRCQALLTFNPPTSAEGQWIIPFFAPWLDKNHPRPAAPGELRFFATIDGKDIEVGSGEPFKHEGETVKPMSRTFIPSRVTDNPYLMGTGYMATLQGLPEPLRSQMLNGDFHAGLEDDPFQVIPSKWVEAAMAKWSRPAKLDPMASLGVDVARGGRDNTVIARRHGMWFDEPLTYPGKETPDGPSTAGLVIAAMRDRSPIHIDVIGVGSAPFDFLKDAGQHALGINVSEGASESDQTGLLQFFNLRTQLFWKMREALDPAKNTGIVLPNDSRLKADLCAPKWKLTGAKIKVESRDEIIARIGRSPDFAAAYCLALIETMKRPDASPPTEHAYSGGSSWMG